MAEQEKAVTVLAGATQVAAEEFCVVVDYSMTLRQMIAAGHYNWGRSDITEERFPIPHSKRGKEEVVIKLVNFGCDMESDNALCELDKMGFRPAKSPELLALGAVYPEKQLEFPIVALGSVWRDSEGRRRAPRLSKVNSYHEIGLGFVDSAWDWFYRFAILRT